MTIDSSGCALQYLGVYNCLICFNFNKYTVHSRFVKVTYVKFPAESNFFQVPSQTFIYLYYLTIVMCELRLSRVISYVFFLSVSQSVKIYG